MSPVTPRALVLFLLAGAPNAAWGQGSLLERWVVDFASDGWSPRWIPPSVLGLTPDSVQARVEVASLIEALEVRSSAALRRIESTVTARTRWHDATVMARMATDTRRLERSHHEMMATSPTPAAALAADVPRSLGSLGRGHLRAAGAWDGGPAWMLGTATESAWHAVAVSTWRANSRYARVAFPVDSLLDLGESHRTTGTTAMARVRVPLTRGLAGLAEARWERVTHDAEPMNAPAFLTASPSGVSYDRGVWAGVTWHEAVGFRWGYRSRTMDVLSSIHREGASAGQVFLGRLDFDQWNATVWRRTGTAEWRGSIGTDRLRSQLSARVETWPYVALWEQLGAQAYRFRASLAGTALWLRGGRQPVSQGGAGWGWAVDLSTHRLDLGTTDWLVTSFGLGRSDVDSTSSFLDPAVVVGADVRRGARMFGGLVLANLAAGIPVYARRVDGNGNAVAETSRDRGRAGYARLKLTWSW